MSLCFCMVGKISAVIRTTLQKKVWQGNAKNTECAICDLLVAGAWPLGWPDWILSPFTWPCCCLSGVKWQVGDNVWMKIHPLTNQPILTELILYTRNYSSSWHSVWTNRQNYCHLGLTSFWERQAETKSVNPHILSDSNSCYEKNIKHIKIEIGKFLEKEENNEKLKENPNILMYL